MNSKRTATPATSLSTSRAAVYGAGDISFSLAFTIVGAYFAVFLTDVVGLRPALAAAAVFAGRTWDYVNDPILGWLSDRTRTRWGRRRPWILVGIPLLVLSFAFMWRVPAFEGAVAKAVWFGLLYLLFDTAATVVFMPYVALIPEMATSYDDRTRLTSWRMAFSIAASLAAFILPLEISGGFVPGNEARIAFMGLIFAVALAPPLLGALFAARERPDYSASPPPRLIDALRSLLRNRAMRYGLGIFLLTWLAVDLVQVLLIYFVTHVIRRGENADVIMGVIFVVALVAVPFWNWVASRTDKRKACALGLSFWIIAQLLMVTLSPGTPLPLILALCAFAGVGVGAAHVFPWAMVPDAMEVDEAQSGERHEGTYSGAVLLVQKVASSAAIPLALLALELSGYQANAPEQGESVALTLRLLMGGGPALLLGSAALLALRYPLDRASHGKLVAELEARRAAVAATKP